MAQKKGISMGIEFVIVIVIAVLILSLGTGFIRNLFKNINTIGIQVTEQAIKDLSDDLKKDPNKKCVVTTGDEATAKRDAENTFKILINNKGPADACYKFTFTPTGKNKLVEGTDYNLDFSQTTWVKGGEVKDIPVLLKVPASAETGKFLFEFKSFKTSSTQTIDPTTCEKADPSSPGFQQLDQDCSKIFILNVE